MLLLFSCRKNDGINSEELANRDLQGQALNWLNAQKVSNSNLRNDKIDLLITNLELDKIRTEEIRNFEKLILIPLASAYKTEYNKDKSVANVLMLIVNKENKIRKGQIVQYQAPGKDLVNEFPINLLHDHYTFKDWNGKLSYYNIFNHLLYEIENRNNNLYSLAKNVIKNESNTISGKTNECRAWYLITTYYYPDGSSNESWEYLYTTCEGSWEDFQSDDLNNSGGVSTITLPPAALEFVVNNNLYWYVKSYETVNGVRDTTLPWKGRFTSQTHNKSEIFNNVTNEHPAHGTWTELQHTGALTNGDITASFFTKGKVIANNGWAYEIDNSKAFSFATVYP